jgi:membrane protein implicated in regulation of membrane protease activity
MNLMVIVWIAAAVVFGVAEAATAGLVSIWFVGGAVAALVAVFCGAPLWAQLALFFAASVLLLVATRPLARRIRERAVPTNLDQVLHRTARVTETVDNERSTGAVYIDGKTWTARSADGSVLARDSMVEIERMEGVKLFVRAIEKED